MKSGFLVYIKEAGLDSSYYDTPTSLVMRILSRLTF